MIAWGVRQEFLRRIGQTRFRKGTQDGKLEGGKMSVLKFLAVSLDVTWGDRLQASVQSTDLRESFLGAEGCFISLYTKRR